MRYIPLHKYSIICIEGVILKKVLWYLWNWNMYTNFYMKDEPTHIHQPVLIQQQLWND